MRVALMTGCAQQALNTDINEATIRLLTPPGLRGGGRQGRGLLRRADPSHGHEEDWPMPRPRANIRAWMAESGGRGLDAIVINTSGCGTTVKDYGHMFRNDPAGRRTRPRVGGLARDISEVLASSACRKARRRRLRVAYHAACSLQHGQQIKTAPKELLKRAGFEVVEPADSHLCCGSAGTYNLLQPEIAQQLKARKVATLEAKAPR